MTTKNTAAEEANETVAENSNSEGAEYAAVFARLVADEIVTEPPAAVESDDSSATGPAADSDAVQLEDELKTPEAAEDDNVDEALIAALAAEGVSTEIEIQTDDDIEITASAAELGGILEAILFVADEPLPFAQICKILGDLDVEIVKTALADLAAEYDARNSGLELREIGGGWRISTRPQHHEFIRKYLKSKPSARLSLPALETLAVIAYKQPVTVPEILEIRGVSGSSAIKTLLEKRLIVTKGRKETVGRPMMYGTSKEFLIQFGLKDLNELPSIEDFEELAS